MWQIDLPLSVPVSGKKHFHLNLNQYRNAHFFTLNKAKVVFSEIVKPRIKHLPKLDKIEILYEVFWGTKGTFDINNITSIQDKFLCDVLTTNEIIPDDNYKHVMATRSDFGGYDKNNPRVVATIINLGDEIKDPEKEEDMFIILTEEEVKKAISLYISSLVSVDESEDPIVNIGVDDDSGEIRAHIEAKPFTSFFSFPSAILALDDHYPDQSVPEHSAEQETHEQEQNALSEEQTTTRRRRRTKAEMEAARLENADDQQDDDNQDSSEGENSIEDILSRTEASINEEDQAQQVELAEAKHTPQEEPVKTNKLAGLAKKKVEAEPEPEAEVTESVPAKPRSIFGNLKKPVNKPID